MHLDCDRQHYQSPFRRGNALMYFPSKSQHKYSFRLSSKSQLTTVDRFGFLYVAASLMEYVPAVSFRTAIFLLVAIWFTADVLKRGVLFASKSFFYLDVLLLLFLSLAVFSVYWAIFNGVEFEDWMRGLVPFLFLGVYFTIDKSEPQLVERIIRWLYIATWVWVIRIAFELMLISVAGSTFGAERLTSVINDSVIPFGIITVPFLIPMLNGFKKVAPIALLLILLLITILTGYRSQTLIILTQIFLLLFIWGANFRKLATLFGVLLLFIVLAFSFLDVKADIDRIENRFEMTDATFEASRLAEWGFALDNFVKNPLFGGGIGLQVPAEITFYGADINSLNTFMVIPDSSGYVHNVTAYLMMTLGAIGVGIYYFIMAGSLLSLAFVRRWHDPHMRRLALTAALSLISLLVYFQVQAAFRMIQMNLATIALLSMLVSLGTQKKLGRGSAK